MSDDELSGYDAWKTTERFDPYAHEDEYLDRKHAEDVDRRAFDTWLIRQAKDLTRQMQPMGPFGEAWPTALATLQKVAREAARTPQSVRQFEAQKP